MSISGIGGIGADWQQMQVQAMRQAMFKQLDQNGDGSVGKGDLQALAQNISQTTGASINVDQVMTKLDANQDGVIDQSECDSAMQQFASARHHHGVHGMGRHHHSGQSQSADGSSDPLQALFQQLDQDGDGTISQSEFQTGLQKLTQGDGTAADLGKLFAALDTNQDGVIDQSEQVAAAKTMANAMENQPPPPPPPQAGISTDLLQALFKKLDQDGDGAISQSEFQTGLKNLTQASGTAAGGDQNTAQAATSTTGLENSTTALTQKLLQDFIFMVQNDAYLQTNQNQKGLEAYA
jgi:Ca2+-binding EF-hand superfamily protein